MDPNDVSDPSDLDDDDGEEEHVTNVELEVLGDARVLKVAPWELCNRTLLVCDPDDLGGLISTDDVFACYDRIFLDGEWRRCFAVYNADGWMRVFDSEGAVLDEPEAGTDGGWQLLETFVEEWKEGYYKLERVAGEADDHDDDAEDSGM